MRSPDEIKKGLECCYEGIDCTKCPYMKACFEDDEKPYGLVVPDALAYIQQLERERDAAVKDCASMPCKTCKKNTKDGFCHTCSLIDGCCTGHVWRGVKEE